MEGRLEVVLMPMTYDYHRTNVRTVPGRTIAIAHTHPDAGAPVPSDNDPQSPYPNFVVSRHALYVTDPATRKYRKVRDDWESPCGGGAR